MKDIGEILKGELKRLTDQAFERRSTLKILKLAPAKRTEK